MKRLMVYFLVFIALWTAPLTAQAQNDAAPENNSTDMPFRDSSYYTLNDGIMTMDEMEQEAAYIHSLCAMNTMQSSYFNCDCVAGSFLIKREKLGPIAVQSDIYEAVMNDASGKCVNAPFIARDSYLNCRDFTKTHRELAPDNEDYCMCVANRAARTFSRRPKFDTMYITSIDYNAMVWCDDTRNRPPKSAARQ